jgi:hypothetical protein
LSQKWGSDDWRVISFVAMRIVWKLLPAQLGRPSSCTSTIDNIVAVAGEHQVHPMRRGSGPPFIRIVAAIRGFQTWLPLWITCPANATSVGGNLTVVGPAALIDVGRHNCDLRQLQYIGTIAASTAFW